MLKELPESDIQRSIIDGLKMLGYLVSCTTVRGFRGGGPKGYGVDKGVPDLLVGRSDWGPVRAAIEVKGAKTKLSPEQQELFDKGLIYIVRSFEDSVTCLKDFEKRYNLRGAASRVSIG